MSTLSKEIVDFDSMFELVKNTYCKGFSNEEFELFKEHCRRTGLSPLAKQIQPVPRWDSKLNREVMTIQTNIDGYRLIADRTGNYAPGKEPVFQYNEKNELVSATSYVKKLTRDGSWHEVGYTAYFIEYCPKTKDGKPTAFWGKMPHVMLAKCAEAAALRKAFPAELSGLYIEEEMTNPASQEQEAAKEIDFCLTEEQVKEIQTLVGDDVGLLNRILEGYKVNSLDNIKQKFYAPIVKNLSRRKQ